MLKVARRYPRSAIQAVARCRGYPRGNGGLLSTLEYLILPLASTVPCSLRGKSGHSRYLQSKANLDISLCDSCRIANVIQQVLYEHIQAIAQQFPSRLLEKYTTAAGDFRLPYWDWARGDIGGEIPEILTWPTIQVIDTDGAGHTISNPLYQYRFPSSIAEDFGTPVGPTSFILFIPITPIPNICSVEQIPNDPPLAH